MNRFLILFICAFAFLYSSCQKESAEPTSPIEGTWIIKSIKGDFAGETNVDVQAFLAAFFPCVYDITYTFNDDKITVDDKGCVDDENASNAIISPLGGVYSFKDNILTINSDGSQLAGPITFSGNTATWTTNDPEEITNEVVVTLEKAN